MQRVPWWKPTLIIAILVFSVLMLYPTYVWQRSLTPEERASLETQPMKAIKAEMEQLKLDRAAAIKEGQSDDVVAQLAEQINAKDTQYQEMREDLIWYRSMSIHFGLDLQGGLRAVLKVNFSQLTGDEKQDEGYRTRTLYDVKERIDRRINALGLAETVTQVQGEDRILVQVPGLADRSQIHELLGRTAKLEFKLVKTPDEVLATLQKIDAGMGETLSQKVTMRDGMPTILDADYARFAEVLKSPETRAYYPVDFELVFGEKQGNVGEGEYHPLWLVSEKEEMTGERIVDAYQQPNLTGMGGMEVLLEFDNVGAQEFREVTRQHVGDMLAIVLDDVVYSAPRIQQEISGGRAQITGSFTPDEANNLGIILRAGNLPESVEVIETNVVGAYLGRDSVEAGLHAGLIGAIIVVILVCAYYSVFGIVANVALLMNVLILVAGMAALKATLTLPGIAGVFLIMGMAVDANVLINERIREEKTSGQERSLFALLSKGYSRAFSAILDGNVTTLITAMILFQFGTGPIKGFAVTLSLGIIISLFTALFVTRTIFDIAIQKGWMKQARVGTITLFKNANYNFIKLGIPALIFSGLFVVAGLVSSSLNGFQLGIEFSGGTEIVAAFDKPVADADVRAALPEPMKNAIIQADRIDPNKLFIKIQKLDAAELQTALSQTEDAVMERLRAMAPEDTSPEDITLASANTADIVFAGLSKNLTTASVNELSSSYRDVSPEVGGEITEQGFWAIVVSSILIIFYMSWRFQFKYAVAAIVALLHDILITVGILAILQVDFSLQIVAGILTVIGYSVNDTIVIFDRIRENRRLGTVDVTKIVNTSINQTLGRTIITGSTTLLILLCQMIWGGAVTYDFVLTLFIGIICGTYSSIFTASPILVLLEERARKKHLAASR